MARRSMLRFGTAREASVVVLLAGRVQPHRTIRLSRTLEPVFRMDRAVLRDRHLQCLGAGSVAILLPGASVGPAPLSNTH